MNNKPYEVRLMISNHGDHEIGLVIEPRGNAYKFPPKSKYLVVITGEQQEVDIVWVDEYTLTVYGWSTGTVEVFDNDKRVSPDR